MRDVRSIVYFVEEFFSPIILSEINRSVGAGGVETGPEAHVYPRQEFILFLRSSEKNNSSLTVTIK